MNQDTPTVVQRPTPPGPQPELSPTALIDKIPPTKAPTAIPAWFETFPMVPGYEILAELGRGGMGVVYEARQLSLNRHVALKMIRATGGLSTTDVTRFLAEAEVLASVRHPNVVQVFECGTGRPVYGSDGDEFPFMALELVPGGTLSYLLLDRGQLEPREAAELLAAITDGVQAVHDAGIVHRDLKPANILLGSGADSGTDPMEPVIVPKVSDFGVARRARSDLTATGTAVGTPEYMAPEQAAGRSKFVGPTADVWALGVMLFEMLTGQRPFQGEDVWSITQQVLTKSVPPVRRFAPNTPRDLELICHKCLEKEPHHRYAGAADLADDLRRFLAGKPVTVRPLGPVSRAWRASRRNPLVAVLVTAVVLSSALGASGSGYQALVANRNADRANEEAEHARTQEENATREADNARTAMSAMTREMEARRLEETARKAADEFSLRTLRVALHARELGEGWRELAVGDVPTTQFTLAAGDPVARGWEWELFNRWFTRSAPVLPPVPGPFMPQRFAVSPDSRWVAVSGVSQKPLGPPVAGGNSIWLWDLVTGGPPVHLMGNFFWPPRILAFDPAGRLVVASDDALRVWELVDPKRPVLEVQLAPPIKGIPQTLPRMVAVQLVADRVTALVAPTDGKKPAKFMTWAFKGPEVTERELPGSEGITAASFAPDGKSLVLAGRTVRRVALDGTILGGPVALGGSPVFVGFLPDGIGAVVGMATVPFAGELVAWDGAGPKLSQRAPFQGSLGSVEIQRDGRVLATSHPNGLWVWNPVTGVSETPARFDLFAGAAAFPDSRRLVVGDFRNGTRLWNPGPAHDVELVCEPQFSRESLSGDRVLVSSSGHGRLLIRTAGTGTATEYTPDPAITGYSAAVWAGDRVALVGPGSKAGSTVLIYDPKTKSVSGRWMTPSGSSVWSCAADPSRIALGYFSPANSRGDTTVELRDVSTGTVLKLLRVPGDGAFVSTLAFAPNGKYLAATRMPAVSGVSGNEWQTPSGRLMLWDLESGALLWDVEVPNGALATAFSADSNLVVVGGWGKIASTHLAKDGKLVREFALPTTRLPGGVSDRISSVQNFAFSPDGTRLIAVGNDGLTIWDAITGQVAHTIPTPCGNVSFSPDGRRLHVRVPGKITTYDLGTR